ncbi:hypothetical protein TNCV_4241382 [Trichonephila clavipes]|nr:hypothetical protein TNCV_4241382 [Trichonephila clavipes]
MPAMIWYLDHWATASPSTYWESVKLTGWEAWLTLDQAWWVGSRTRGRCCPVTLLSPDITEDPHCRVADARLISLYSKFLCWWGMEVRRVKCRLRCRPRHLTVVQNYEV